MTRTALIISYLALILHFFWYVENCRAKLAEKRKKEEEKKKQEEEKVKEEEEKVGLQFRIVQSAIGICTM